MDFQPNLSKMRKNAFLDDFRRKYGVSSEKSPRFVSGTWKYGIKPFQQSAKRQNRRFLRGCALAQSWAKFAIFSPSRWSLRISLGFHQIAKKSMLSPKNPKISKTKCEIALLLCGPTEICPSPEPSRQQTLVAPSPSILRGAKIFAMFFSCKSDSLRKSLRNR